MDPAENVRIGTRYLRYLYRQFGGDTKMVLAAYNAGETAVRRYGGVPPYPETRNYLRRVASRRAWYQRAFERRVGHLFAVPQVDVPIAKIR